MDNTFDYWGLLAGVALFLVAMSQLEAALKQLGGRSLSNYLRRQAGSRLNGVAAGIVATAVLQSSSVVGLMVLAFTGAGLLSLTAALGIIFGSNVGTTLTGWIVATIGFKFEIFEASLPLIAIGGITSLFARDRTAEYGRLALSLGLLLLGLQMMKASVASVEQLIDIDDLAGLAPWQYLLFGTVVAAVIQSSSATIMITLAALNAGIVSLPNAAAVAIGADLGTTTTVIIGAIGGSQTKKQVAAGHVLFNCITDAVAFMLRAPLLAVVAATGIENPLYSLVAFHSLFNIVGLLIFVPLTGAFASLLERMVPARTTQEASYLGEVSTGVGAAAVVAVENETARLISRALRLARLAFDPPLPEPAGIQPVPKTTPPVDRSFDELYRATKRLEGELVDFTIQLQAGALETRQSERLGQLLCSAREATHSAKSIKDTRHNLVEFEDSLALSGTDYATLFRESMQAMLADVYRLPAADITAVTVDEFTRVLEKIHARHDAIHQKIYADVREDRVNESSVSSLLNVNREMLSSNRSLLLALGFFHLDKARAEDLERTSL